MATGLEALGLACNIMQVISFAGGLISTFNAIRGGHSPDVAITTTATQMSNAFKTLAQSLGQATRPLNKDEMEMAVIAEQCLDAAVALKAEVDKIWDGNTKGSYKAALTGAARKMLNQGKIERLEKVLRVHRETIENRLLQRICTRSDAILLHQDSGFEKLDASLRRFIAAFAAGETRLAGLIGDQSESVKEHVTLETGQLRDDLYTHMASESGKTHVVLSEMSARVTSEVSQTRRELSLKFKETAAAQASEAEHQRLLKSLEYETMNERRNQVVESYRDTFHWIFGPSHDSTSLDAERTDNGPIKPSVRAKSSESFLRWLHSEGPALYWISGKAGSGKSTLMKFLVDNPQTEAGLGDFTIISHFVWMAGQPMERSIRGIACSLLRQLLQDDPGVSALVLNMIPRSRRNKFSADWSVNDLEAALMLALAASPKPVCVFLNGLDEIDPLEEQDKALNLVDKLSSRVSRLRICVSSRPEPIFQRRLGNFPALRLQDLTREDIRRYTSGALRRDFVSTDPEFREFVEQVCDKSDGVFLWVALAVKSLQRGKQDENTVAELRKRLETLPSDLHRLYEGMWQRLNDDEPIYREDGARFLNYVLRGKDFYGYGYVFDWDVCELMLTRDNLFRHKILEEGYRPSRDEWISRVKATTKQLVRRCAGLLEITGTTEVTPSARLIHRSAKEFLENTPHGQQILQYDTSTMEDRIFNVISAEIALTRLNVLQQVGEDVLPLTAHESSLSDMVERLLILFYRGCVSLTRVLEMMRHAEAVFQTGLWYSLSPTRRRLQSHSPYSPPRVDLDFLGVAVRAAFVEIVVATLDNLEESAPNASLSATYKGYLVATACLGRGSISFVDRVGLVALLLRRWSNTSIGHWGLHFVEVSYGFWDISRWMVPCTPMMALCRLPFLSPHRNSFCTILEEMLRRRTGGTLADVTTFTLVEQSKGECSPGDASDSDAYCFQLHHFEFRSKGLLSNTHLLVEANMSYVLVLYLRILQKGDPPVELSRNLVAEVARHSVPKAAKVWYVCENLKSALGDRDQASKLHPVAPASEAESSCLLEDLLEFSRVGYGSTPQWRAVLVIPGFGHKVREVARRGISYHPDELERDLEQAGLLVQQEAVKDWPPKPYAS